MDQIVNGRETFAGGNARNTMMPAGAANWNSGWQGMNGMNAGMNGGMNGGMNPGMNDMYTGGGGMSGMGDPGGMNGMWGNTPANSPNAPMHTSSSGNHGMQMLDLDTGLSAEAIDNPVSLAEARLGSLRSLLQKLIGHYIVSSFLIGTEEAVSWEGFLYSVGNDYIVIFQPDIGRYVMGDLYSLKFVEFYNEKGTVPPCIGSRRRDAHGRW